MAGIVHSPQCIGFLPNPPPHPSPGYSKSAVFDSIPLTVTVGENRAAVVDNISWQDLHVVLVKFWDQLIFFFFLVWEGGPDFVQLEKMEAVSVRSLTSFCPTLHCLNHSY